MQSISVQTNEEYLKQKLEWVKRRLLALDDIGTKLREMRSLAAYASDNYISCDEAREFNARLYVLQQEITGLDEETKMFWMDCQ